MKCFFWQSSVAGHLKRLLLLYESFFVSSSYDLYTYSLYQQAELLQRHETTLPDSETD